MFHATQMYIEQLYLYVNFYMCVCVYTEREKRKKGREGRGYIE